MLPLNHRYRRLFAAADNGEISLPEPVATARATLNGVNQAFAALSEPDPIDRPRQEVISAALASSDPAHVDVSPLLQHARHVQDYDLRCDVLRAATGQAADHLLHALQEHTDVIVTEHIRPAGNQLGEQITKAVKTLDGINTLTTDAVLSAPEKARRAYLDLEQFAAQYARLRAALTNVTAHRQVEYDTEGDHAEFRGGLCTVWPDRKRLHMMPAATPPWPADGRGRLIWMVRNGHQPWWPTPAERDAAWMDAHGEAYRDQQQRAARAKSAKAWTRRTAS